MEPVFSKKTKGIIGPPELTKPLPEALARLSPPYSIPYAEVDNPEKFPGMRISEWRLSEEEIELLKKGSSIYLIVYSDEHPLARLWVGPENFDPK